MFGNPLRQALLTYVKVIERKLGDRHTLLTSIAHGECFEKTGTQGTYFEAVTQFVKFTRVHSCDV